MSLCLSGASMQTIVTFGPFSYNIRSSIVVVHTTGESRKVEGEYLRTLFWMLAEKKGEAVLVTQAATRIFGHCFQKQRRAIQHRIWLLRNLLDQMLPNGGDYIATIGTGEKQAYALVDEPRSRKKRVC